MCGLAGVAAPDIPSTDVVSAFKDMMFFNMLRGMDGSGVAAITKTASINLLKQPDPWHWLEKHPKFTASVSFSNDILIGHTRHKTVGEASIYNTHPFQIGNHFVGVHNGTLNWDSKNKLEKSLQDTFGTDSEALLTAIAEEGPENVIPTVEGAWALVWYQSIPSAAGAKPFRNLHMIRNKERTLWVYHDKKLNCLFWASERFMLASALTRRIKEPPLDEIKLLEEDTLYVWEIPYDKNTQIEDPVTQKIEGFKRPTVVPTFPSQGWRGHVRWHHGAFCRWDSELGEWVPEEEDRPQQAPKNSYSAVSTGHSGVRQQQFVYPSTATRVPEIRVENNDVPGAVASNILALQSPETTKRDTGQVGSGQQAGANENGQGLRVSSRGGAEGVKPQEPFHYFGITEEAIAKHWCLNPITSELFEPADLEKVLMLGCHMCRRLVPDFREAHVDMKIDGRSLRNIFYCEGCLVASISSSAAEN